MQRSKGVSFAGRKAPYLEAAVHGVEQGAWTLRGLLDGEENMGRL